MDGNVTWRLTGAVLAVAVLTSCMAGSPQFFEPTPEVLQNREMKTRNYEGISDVDILSASAAALQDLGFSIDESETKLGIIVGSKRSDASSDVEEALQVVTAILSLGHRGHGDRRSPGVPGFHCHPPGVDGKRREPQCQRDVSADRMGFGRQGIEAGNPGSP